MRLFVGKKKDKKEKSRIYLYGDTRWGLG